MTEPPYNILIKVKDFVLTDAPRFDGFRIIHRKCIQYHSDRAERSLGVPEGCGQCGEPLPEEIINHLRSWTIIKAKNPKIQFIGYPAGRL